MKKITTIKLGKDTVKLLNEMKVHPRQPYDEVISLLLKHQKTSLKFSQHIPADITTIKISKSNVESLDKLKVHPRQSYEEVVLALIKGYQEK